MRISLLVPFRADGPRDERIRSWNWVRQRWTSILPEAEVCIGTDDGGYPFSKAVAVNDAYRRSTGDMLVIVDADSWVERSWVMEGIAQASYREHLVVPWWKAHRLHADHSEAVMAADPRGPLPVTAAMREACVNEGPSPASAAMVLCIQRTAFERVGGFDPRFRGWGSEDVSFGIATGTLLGRNEYTLGEAFALYHKTPTKGGMRVWRRDKGLLNVPLYERYYAAHADLAAMTAICAEHPIGPTPVGPSPTLNMDDLMQMPDMRAPTAPIVREEQRSFGDGERVRV